MIARSRIVKTLFAVVAACAAAAVGQNDTAAGFQLSGYGSLEEGQIVKGITLAGPVDHKWLETSTIGLGLEASNGKRARLYLGAECLTNFSFVTSLTNIDTYRETQYSRFSIQPTRTEGQLALVGGFDKPILELGVGYFPFKYNADVRNLGEYLFRSSTYPQYLTNYFDTPYARLLGLHISSTLPIGSFASLHQDLMLTSEVLLYPNRDFSPSYVVDFAGKRIYDIGAGICFSNLFPINADITEPKTDQNRLADSGGYYSFAGTKLMAHFSLDPKGFLSEERAAIFGKEDGKIYGEISMLGVENQGDLYKWPMERVPIMLGFNVPAFKVLDVAAVELEYWSNRYPNSSQEVYASIIPQPFTEDLAGNLYDHSRLKWSVYAKKEVVKHFSIIAQVARDHIQPLTFSLPLQDRTDVLQAKDDWWWNVKTLFSF